MKIVKNLNQFKTFKIRQLIKLKFNILIKKFLCIKDKCLIGDYKDLLKYKTSNSIKVINKLLDICNMKIIVIQLQSQYQ